jgi:hypothetical protein
MEESYLPMASRTPVVSGEVDGVMIVHTQLRIAALPDERPYTLRDGPQWPTGAVVDVTVKLGTLTGTEVTRLSGVRVREMD